MDAPGIRVDRSVPGLTVVTELLPWCHTAAVGVWIGAGSAHEHPDEHGAAHFLEHVLFKRTDSRSGREISEEIDRIGGDLNAFTAREHTCYHVHVPAQSTELAVDLLVDVVARGRCDPEDVEVERDVILDELAGREDDPEDLVGDLVLERVLGPGPLGRPVIGTEESVGGMRAETLAAVRDRFLTTRPVVVAAAGRVDHDALVARLASGPLGALPGRAPAGGSEAGTPGDLTPATSPSGVTPVVHRVDSEQTFLALGRRSPARDDPARAAAQVLAAVAGGGLSSRLFHRVREELGLAYSVYAGVEQFAPVGVTTVVGGCSTERFAEMSAEVAGVLSALRVDPPTAAEVDRAIGHLTGSITLGLDDPMSRMYRLGRHLVDRGEVVPVAQSLDRLRAVTAAQVRAAASDWTTGWTVAAVGPDPRRGAAAVATALAD